MMLLLTPTDKDKTTEHPQCLYNPYKIKAIVRANINKPSPSEIIWDNDVSTYVCEPIGDIKMQLAGH